MNLFDLSSTNADRETYALVSTGGWVGTLPDGYTKTVDGKKFTVRTLASGIQVLVHELPGGGVVRICGDGSINWHGDDGYLHREDGPAITRPDGSTEWWVNRKRHREDGPAMTWPDGTEAWYYRGRRHREDGPASTWANGTTVWYYHDHRHREDGPAIVYADGTEEYYIRGKQVNKEELP